METKTTPILGRPAADEPDERSREVAGAYAGLLRGLAHELRTPLGSVQMMAELIADDFTPHRRPGELDKLVKIQRACAGMKDVLEHVSVLGKLADGQFEPAMATVRLDDVLATAARNNEEKAAENGVDVTVISDKDLEIRTDGLLLRRLLEALLGRAVDVSGVSRAVAQIGASTGPHLPGRVIVRAAAGEEGVTITVADAGPFLGEADLETLFEPFSAGQRRSQGGSSLHLTVARALAELLDARLTASSGEQGTTLKLFLPTSPSANDR